MNEKARAEWAGKKRKSIDDLEEKFAKEERKRQKKLMKKKVLQPPQKETL